MIPWTASTLLSTMNIPVKIQYLLLTWTCLTITSLECHGLAACENSQPAFLDVPIGDERCYCNNSDSSSLDINYWKTLNDSITFEVDAESGIGEVQFTLPRSRCLYDRYEVNLQLVNNATKLSCSPGATEAHSQRHYHTLDNIVTSETISACTDRAKLKFRYIFSGCYQVKVAPMIRSSVKQAAVTYPRYFETKWTKGGLELRDANVVISPIYNHFEKSFVPRLSLSAPVMGPMMVYLELNKQIGVSSKNNLCNDSGQMRDCCKTWDSDLQGSCNRTFNRPGPNCSNVDATVECSFENVPPGNYCAVIWITDERCTHDSLWQPSICIFYHAFEVKDIKHVDSPATSHDSDKGISFAILGAVSGVVLLGLILWLVTLGRRCSPIEDLSLTEMQNDASEINSPLIPQQILLLYARDCEIFMDVMSSFRQLLQKYCKCEVVDCYADMYKREMNMSKPDWLLSHLKHKHVKVVIVDTDCASLHEEAQRTFQPRLRYCDPDPADELFPLALSAIKGDILICDQYTKFVRVKLSNFKSAAEGNNRDGTLSFLTPYTQYKMPEHFIKLVCSLRQLNSLEQIQICDNDLSDLSAEVDTLVQYKKENPLYLDSLIIRNNMY